MIRSVRFLTTLAIMAGGISLAGCASKTEAEVKPKDERPYKWVEVPGSRVRQKVYLGETPDGTAPVSSITKGQLDDMQRATMGPANVGGAP